MNKIHLKRNIEFPRYNYIILLLSTQIGEIEFMKKNNIIIICYMQIYPEYRNNHYGYQVIEYLLSHYKANCIIGESVFYCKNILE